MKLSQHLNRNESSPSNVVTLDAPPIPCWLLATPSTRNADEFTVAEFAKAAGIAHDSAGKRLNREVSAGRLSARLGVFGGASVKLYKEVR